MEEESGVGSIEIGNGNGIYAVLTTDTIKGLEAALAVIFREGRPFTLRLREDATGQISSTIVTPSTSVKFGYKDSDVDHDEAEKRAITFVESIRADNDLNLAISKD